MTNFAKQLLIGAALLAAPQVAQAQNNPAPAGPVIFNLAGRTLPKVYTTYSASFTATSALTNLSFAFRNDPAFFSLDNVTLRQNNAGANLVVNGDFEAGVVGAQAPVGWTYLNTFGATAAGVVRSGCGVAGNCYYDGAVGSYDAITQAIATVLGQSYTVSFALLDNSNQVTASAVDVPGLEGINLVVYAGEAQPTAAAVPETATWAMLLVGFGAMGAGLRSRRRSTSVRFA